MLPSCVRVLSRTLSGLRGLGNERQNSERASKDVYRYAVTNPLWPEGWSQDGLHASQPSLGAFID